MKIQVKIQLITVSGYRIIASSSYVVELEPQLFTLSGYLGSLRTQNGGFQ